VREWVGGAGGCKVHAGREVRGAIAAGGIHHEAQGGPCADKAARSKNPAERGIHHEAQGGPCAVGIAERGL
jgi:hypothetical protein